MYIDTFESNKLIAKFMGAKKTGSSTGLNSGGIAQQYSAKITDRIDAIFYDKEGAWTDFHEMKFHSSWDWLMPVVEKIERKDFGFKMCRKVVEVYVDSTKEVILKTKEKSRFQSLYKAVVEFIEWHNKNSK